MAKTNFGISIKLLTNELQAGITKTQAKLKSFANTIKNTFIGLGTAGLTREIFNVGRAFEKQMAIVQSITNASKAQMQALTAEARRMGETTQYTAAQAGKALENLTRNGMSAGNAIKSLSSTLALAQANAIELGDAANLITNSLNAFKMNAEEASRVADVLSKTAASSATNVLDLGEALKIAAPIGETVGMSIEGVSAALAVLANNGIKGSDAGTGLKQVLVSLAKPTKNASKVFKKYGLDIDEQKIKTEGFVSVIRELSESGLGKSLKDITGVFGRLGGPRASILLNSPKALDDMFIKLKASAGTAQRMMRQSTEGTADYEIRILISKLQEFGIQLFNSTKNLSVGIIKSIQNVVDFVKSNMKAVAGAIAGAFAFKWIAGAIASLRTYFTNYKVNAIKASVEANNTVARLEKQSLAIHKNIEALKVQATKVSENERLAIVRQVQAKIIALKQKEVALNKAKNAQILANDRVTAIQQGGLINMLKLGWMELGATIKAVMASTGIGLIITALGSAVGYTVGKITDEIGKLREIQSETAKWGNVSKASGNLIKEANKDAKKSAQEVVTEEKARVRTLLKIAQDEQRAEDDRKKALKSLHEVTSEYHGALDKTGKLINNNTGALKKYIDKLYEAAEAEAKYNKMVEYEKKAIDLKYGTPEDKGYEGNFEEENKLRRKAATNLGLPADAFTGNKQYTVKFGAKGMTAPNGSKLDEDTYVVYDRNGKKVKDITESQYHATLETLREAKTFNQTAHNQINEAKANQQAAQKLSDDKSLQDFVNRQNEGEPDPEADYSEWDEDEDKKNHKKTPEERASERLQDKNAEETVAKRMYELGMLKGSEYYKKLEDIEKSYAEDLLKIHPTKFTDKVNSAISKAKQYYEKMRNQELLEAQEEYERALVKYNKQYSDGIIKRSSLIEKEYSSLQTLVNKYMEMENLTPEQAKKLKELNTKLDEYGKALDKAREEEEHIKDAKKEVEQAEKRYAKWVRKIAKRDKQQELERNTRNYTQFNGILSTNDPTVKKARWEEYKENTKSDFETEIGNLKSRISEAYSNIEELTEYQLDNSDFIKELNDEKSTLEAIVKNGTATSDTYSRLNEIAETIKELESDNAEISKTTNRYRTSIAIAYSDIDRKTKLYKKWLAQVETDNVLDQIVKGAQNFQGFWGAIDSAEGAIEGFVDAVEEDENAWKVLTSAVNMVATTLESLSRVWKGIKDFGSFLGLETPRQKMRQKYIEGFESTPPSLRERYNYLYNYHSKNKPQNGEKPWIDSYLGMTPSEKVDEIYSGQKEALEEQIKSQKALVSEDLKAVAEQKAKVERPFVNNDNAGLEGDITEDVLSTGENLAKVKLKELQTKLEQDQILLEGYESELETLSSEIESTKINSGVISGKKGEDVNKEGEPPVIASNDTPAYGKQGDLYAEEADNINKVTHALGEQATAQEAATLAKEVDSTATEVNTGVKEANAVASETATAASVAETTASATETAVKSGEAVADATASGAKLPFPANVAAIAAGVAAVVSALSMVGAFADGGVVGGKSYSGDKVLARVNSGEMIMNQGHQKRLWNAINSGRLGSNGGGQVEFKISGQNLYGVLRNHSKIVGKVGKNTGIQ